jgi:hypothetical protein
MTSEPPPYGQPPYEPSQYQAPQYGQPGQYAQPNGTQHVPVYPGAHQDWGTLEQPPKRGRGKLIAAAATAAVVVAGVATGVVLLRGSDKADKPQGASSPQELATRIADALTDLDQQALLKLLDPGEFKTIGTLVDAATTRAKKEGLPDRSADARNAVSLKITGLTTSVEQPAADLAFITITAGQYSATIDPAKLRGGRGVPGKGPQTRSGSLQNETPLAAVKVDGKWYFSPTTTALEAARIESELPEPDWSHPAELSGAESPEAVLPAALDAISKQDVKAGVGLVAADEVPALRYYFTSFPEQGPQEDFSFSTSNLRTHVDDLSNGFKKVVVDSVDFSATSGDETQTGSLKGLCVTVDGQQSCSPPEFTNVLGDELFTVVSKGPRGWQLNPIATYVEEIRLAVTNGSTNLFLQLANLQYLAPIAATVPAGTPTEVRINDAGFAHVKITGKPNSCVDTTSDDIYLTPEQEDITSSCYGVELDSAGKGAGVLVTDEPTGKEHGVTVTLTDG